MGTITSVAGLISQAIGLIQQIQKARADVAGASELLTQHSGTLDSIASYLELVQEVEALQIAAVSELVEKVIVVGEKLKQHLNDVKARMSKSSSTQSIHALKFGDKDGEDLEEVLRQLDRARLKLTFHIQPVNVGITRSVRDGFVATMPIVRRTNQNVERVLHEGLRIANLPQNREADQRGTLP